MIAIEDLVRPSSLAACFGDVRRRSPAAGVDRLTPAAYENGLDERLERLSHALVTGTWEPSALVRLRQRKPSGGVRRLAIPTVDDRIVIEVLRRGLEPLIERTLSVAAHAYRPGRSARTAVELVASRIEEGARWVALADVREFFDSIVHEDLALALDELPFEGRVRALLDRLMAGHALRPGHGLAQGSALSPVLSNLALRAMDRALLDEGFALVRYCDNLCVTTHAEGEARRALAAMRREVARRGLSLKREASQVVEARQGFVWLGFWLGSEGRRVSEAAVASLRRRLDAAGEGKGGSRLREHLRPIVRGWAQYFDAELPAGASLGRHHELVRALLDELRGQGTTRHGEAAALVDDGDAIEGWDEPEDEHAEEPPACGDRGGESDEWLREADRLAAAGAFAAAEQAHAAALRLRDAPSEEPSVACGPAWDDEVIDGFLGLFCAGQEVHEVAEVRGESGRRDFVRVERPPGPAEVRGHLQGSVALAVQPRLADGTCALGVLDVDGVGPESATAVRAHVDALCSVARAWGFEVLVEQTGGRGMHVWLPLDRRVAAVAVAEVLARLAREAGQPAAGVRVERLPGAGDEPDLHAQAITLPLGRHVETGARSKLWWGSGRGVEEDGTGLLVGVANDPARLLERVPSHELREEETTAEVVPGERLGQGAGVAVRRVMEGCAVLRHLTDKAAAVGHLDHAERLSLLYSLGHLGGAGQRAIHEIVGRCGNYSRGETERQIGRLSGLPISCTRMREKHVTAELAPKCACDFGDVRRRGGYPTPLLHATGFRRVWRDELRGRRAAELVARERPLAGVVAVAEAGIVPRGLGPADGEVVAQRHAPHDGEGATAREGAGVLVAGVPPHEWA